MQILGIETSCDETAASVVTDGRTVRSNVIVSSLKEHSKYGGVIPEIASRKQMESITAVVDEALNRAKVPLKKISAVAVTTQPGLIGSLLVGTSFARSLSYCAKLPLIGVDHIKAHIYANFLKYGNNFPDKKKSNAIPQLPAIGLVVSGGHTNLYYIKNIENFRLIGHTLDDAVGEAFDKVARVLNLGYPGGPVIDRLAKKGTNSSIQFTCAKMKGTLNFSFSGIKTAVLYYSQKHGQDKDFSVEKIAYSFQNSVIHALSDKCLAACEKYKTSTLLIGGGVAANSGLRALLAEKSKLHSLDVFYPDFDLCMDNAAMIAGLGFHQIKGKRLQTES